MFNAIKENDLLRPIIIEIEKLKQQSEHKKAIKLIKDTIIKYNDDYRLYEELADTYLYMWKINDANKAVDYALIKNPESATGHYLKWFLCLNYDDFDTALSHLEKSNKMFSNNPEVLRNLGWAYVMTNQVERWIAILQRALKLAPWDRLIIEDLAMALIWIWEVEQWNKLLKEIWSTKKIDQSYFKLK